MDAMEVENVVNVKVEHDAGALEKLEREHAES